MLYLETIAIQRKRIHIFSCLFKLLWIFFLIFKLVGVLICYSLR